MARKILSQSPSFWRTTRTLESNMIVRVFVATRAVSATKIETPGPRCLGARTPVYSKS